MTDSLPSDLLALASLDAHDGLRRIGGDPEVYRRQLRRFRDHHAGFADALRQLAAAGDLPEAAARCHAFKGISGNLGARALHALVAALDARLKLGQAPDAADLDRLQSHLNAVLRDIDHLAPEPAARAGEPLDPTALHDRLSRLGQALEMDLGAAEGLLAELRAGTLDTPLAPAIAILAAAIESFDIDRAQSLLSDLTDASSRPAAE